ncbi:hypothetical protein [Piscinibacter sp.]|uniref:hypothetical protein n=1 Tax=Piscinibacter sp. TaxID=1903157 RepID=UPI0039E33D3D
MDDDQNLCFAKVERLGENPRLVIDVTLDEMKVCSLAELQEKVGGTVVGLLKIWNKELFADWDSGKTNKKV